MCIRVSPWNSPLICIVAIFHPRLTSPKALTFPCRSQLWFFVLYPFRSPACGPAAQGLARLEELVRKVLDLVDNRVESNLRAISNTMLVELPADRSFTFDEFVSTQQRFQKKQAEQLGIRNEEVREGGKSGVAARIGTRWVNKSKAPTAYARIHGTRIILMNRKS